MGRGLVMNKHNTEVLPMKTNTELIDNVSTNDVYKSNKNNVSEIKGLLYFTLQRFKIRYNTFIEEFQVFDNKFPERGWRARNNRIDNSLFALMKSFSQNVYIQDINLLFTENVEEYNPIQDYLHKHTWCPDEDDYISMLANTVKAEYQEEWVNDFRNWLVILVGQMQNTKEKLENNQTIMNSLILTLIGSAGIGKTYWLNHLLPKELSRYIKHGFSDIKNKDANIALSRNILILIDEIDTLSKAEKEKLAKIATDISVEERLAYERYDSKMVRIASFAATTNVDDFLLSGAQSNRRFLIHKVLELNSDHGIDMDKVFAQANYLFNNSLYDNSKKYHSFRYEKVKQYEQTDMDFEVVSRYFIEADAENQGVWYSTSEIYEILRTKGYSLSRAGNSFLGTILNRFVASSKNKKILKGIRMYNLRQIYNKIE